jgi:hypothetical protein
MFRDDQGKLITTIPVEITSTPSIAINPSKISVKVNFTESKAVSVIVNITNPNIRSLTSPKVQWLNDPHLTDEDLKIVTYPYEYPQRLNVVLYNSSNFKEGIYFGYITLSRPGIDRPVATIDLVMQVVGTKPDLNGSH